MKIYTRFNCGEQIGNPREGEYDVPEGATIEDAMTGILEKSGVDLTIGIKTSLVFLVNNHAAKWETVLCDGDELRVLYRIMGG